MIFPFLECRLFLLRALVSLCFCMCAYHDESAVSVSCFLFFPRCCYKVPSLIISHEKVTSVMLVLLCVFILSLLNSPSALNEFPPTALAIKQRWWFTTSYLHQRARHASFGPPRLLINNHLLRTSSSQSIFSPSTQLRPPLPAYRDSTLNVSSDRVALSFPISPRCRRLRSHVQAGAVWDSSNGGPPHSGSFRCCCCCSCRGHSVSSR